MAFDPDAPVEVLDAPVAAKPAGKPVAFDPTAPVEPETSVAEFHPNETVEAAPEAETAPSPKEAAEAAGIIPKSMSAASRGARARMMQRAMVSNADLGKPLIGFGDAQGSTFTIPKIPEQGDGWGIVPMGPIPVPVPKGVQAGVANALGETMASFTSPSNIALLVGTGGLGKVAQRLVAGGFGVSMIKDAIAAVPNAQKVFEDPASTAQQKAEVATKIVTSLLLGTAAGTHALTGEAKVSTSAEPPKLPVNAAATPPLKTAPAEFLGIEGEGTSKQFTAYRLTEDIPGHVKGSSVDGKTLEAAGYKLPEMPAEESTIPPSAQKFDPTNPIQDVVPPEVLAEEQGARVGVDDEAAIEAAAAKQAAPKGEEPPAVLSAMMDRALENKGAAEGVFKPDQSDFLMSKGLTVEEANRMPAKAQARLQKEFESAKKSTAMESPEIYHGATQPFETAKMKPNSFFSSKQDVAEAAAASRAKNAGEENPVPRLIKGKAKFENPVVIDAEGDFAGNLQFGKKAKAYRKALADPDVDGIVIKNTKDEGDLYVVKSAKQFTESISQPPESGAEKPVLSTIQSEPKQTSPVVEEPFETIKSAAIKTPSGTVHTGKWHPAAYDKYMSASGLTREAVVKQLEDGSLQDGFLTSTGRFVDRDEAAKVAAKADQFKPGKEGDSAFAGGLKNIEDGPGTINAKATIEEQPRQSSAELKLNNADLGMPPVSGMSREARRAELEAAGIKTYKGKALEDLNPAELSNAVGKARRGILTPDGEKATSGVIAGSKAEEWADKVLKAKKGQLNAGIDPEQFTAYTVKGLANFERGVTDFAKWSKQMVKEFGDEIKPHLEKLFRATQELSSEGSRAAEATPEEIQAFLADYRNAPDAPATESTPVTRTQRLAKGLVTAGNKTLGLLTSGLAKESAPKTTALSEESGNALVRYASAAKAAPEIARSYAGQVLGSKIHDAAFANKLGAVLVEDRLHGIKAGLLKQMEEAKKVGDDEEALEFKELADKVTSIIGKKDSPLKSIDDYKAALKDPEMAAAIERHKSLVMPLAEKQHADLGGRISKPGPDTGAFVNLEPLDEAGETVGGKKTGGTSKGDLTVPFKKGSAFSKRAFGSAEGYVTDYNEIVNRMLSGNLEETAKRQMYDQLTKDGLAVILPPGESPPEINGAPPRKIQIERRGLPGPGGGRTMIRNMYVDRTIYPEVMRAMNLDETFQGAAVTHLSNLLNTLQIKGPVDGILHVANILTSIAGSPGGKSVVADLVRRFPGVNVVDALAKIAARSRDVIADSPEVRKQIAELARIGAGRAPHEGATGMTKLIQVVDKAARLARDDMFDNLVERDLAKDTEKNRREFVNQVGQYNARLMGQLSAKLKETGVSPFIVAGKTFNRLALRRVTASTGVEPASAAANIKMRAFEIGSLVTSLVAVPMVLNYMLTGKPTGRPGTPFGAIDTGHDNGDGKAVYVDPQQWTGVRRGLRMTGLNAVASGIQHDEGGGRIFDSAVRDMIASYIHPAAGPLVNTAATLATGYNASGYKQASPAQQGGSQIVQNALAAVKQLNPFVGNAIKGIQNEDLDAKGVATGVGMGAAKPFMDALGVKETGKVSPLQAIRTAAGKYNDQLGIQRDAAGRISPYADLNRALSAENLDKAQDALQKVIEQKAEAIPGGASSTAKLAMARRAVAEYYNREAREPFTGNLARERAFKATLDEDQLASYEEAKVQRRQMAQSVRSLIYGR